MISFLTSLGIEGKEDGVSFAPSLGTATLSQLCVASSISRLGDGGSLSKKRAEASLLSSAGGSSRIASDPGPRLLRRSFRVREGREPVL